MATVHVYVYGIGVRLRKGIVSGVIRLSVRRVWIDATNWSHGICLRHWRRFRLFVMFMPCVRIAHAGSLLR
jgi:hypothetical protein